MAVNTSKKVIHNIGCYRYKLQEITLFRTKGTHVTLRWQGAQVRDVVTWGKRVEVRLQQKGFAKPFRMKIAEFTPIPGCDKTSREGLVEIGGEDVPFSEEAGNFALVSVDDARNSYKTYIEDNWESEFVNSCNQLELGLGTDKQGQDDVSWTLVEEIYGLALHHYRQLPGDANWDFCRVAKDWKPSSLPEKDFLKGILKMCFVLRTYRPTHSSNSYYTLAMLSNSTF